MRVVRWTAAIVGGVLVVVWVAVAIGSRTSVLHDALVRMLSDQLDSEVELQSFHVSIFPTLRIAGDGLRLRHKGRTDVPPLIEIRHFSANGSIWGMFRRPRRVRLVTLDGLQIRIPPGGLNADTAVKDDNKGDKAGGKKDGSGTPTDGPVIIGHLVSTDAELVLVPRDRRKEARRFAIHDLKMDDLGFHRAMPFTATLTNPIPKGSIQTSGTFGPWQAGEPGETPVSGTYGLRHANMDTIGGLGGMLSSDGRFTGALGNIDVEGTADIPDFSIDVSGQPVPLNTRFHVVVDGTNGDTYLRQVDATLRETPISASGAVVGTPGVKGRTVKLDVRIPAGRIEDVLTLAVKSKTPVMIGRLDLQASLLLPPGKEKVADRLQLDGRFGVGSARFTAETVQQKIGELSRRSQGKGKDAKQEGGARKTDDRVLSDLRGHFALKDGVTRFSSLTFGMPGAQVRLAGTYGLRSERLDFKGTLRMQATVSQAADVGGIKGFLLKAFDPLFKKKGAGAVVPIKIEGTKDHPKFGLDAGRVLGGG